MRIVLINGHIACLKTTLGYLLAPMMDLAHVTNSVLGAFVSDAGDPLFQRLREERYRRAAAITRQYLNEGVSVVLDGTFSRREWRDAIYRLADKFGAEEVVAITCVCSNLDLIEDRLAYRRRVPDLPDAAANSWDAYNGSVQAFESIKDDAMPSGRGVSRLTFDSGSFTVRRDAVLTPFAESVALAVERLIWSGKLRQPQFGSVQGPCAADEICAERLISIEGLSASGKSTQTRRLTDILVRQGKRACLFEEFSEGSIGTYLRGQSGLESDHRVRVGAASAPSHTESLLVIGDAIGRIRKLREVQPNRVPPHEVIVADGYTLAHIAHGLALLPEGPEATLVSSMSEALTEILAPLQHVARSQNTIFLRISPSLAIQRMERRMSVRLSAESRQFIMRISDIYDELVRRSGATEIDASGSPDDVTRRIAEATSD